MPPEFVNEVVNRNISVAENANITLSCRATGNPIPKIKWRREDGQPIIIGQEKGMPCKLLVFSIKVLLKSDNFNRRNIIKTKLYAMVNRCFQSAGRKGVP